MEGEKEKKEDRGKKDKETWCWNEEVQESTLRKGLAKKLYRPSDKENRQENKAKKAVAKTKETADEETRQNDEDLTGVINSADRGNNESRRE